MKADELAVTIHKFVETNFIIVREGGLKDDDLLIGTGVVDSTGILEVIMFLEERFGIHIDDDDLIPKNFGSVRMITEFLLRKFPEKVLEAV